MNKTVYSEITPEINKLADKTKEAGYIDSELFTKYDVKRGLRDLNGKGVLAGLTNISDVRATKIVDGVTFPDHGKLFYRGYNVSDLVDGFSKEGRFGFEEVTYLLLFNKLPNKEELDEFSKLLAHYRSLPTSFVRDIIKHFACGVVFEGNRCACEADVCSIRQCVAHHTRCANLEFARLLIDCLGESVLATMCFISHHDDVSALR